jgi:hypothetical protein
MVWTQIHGQSLFSGLPDRKYPWLIRGYAVRAAMRTQFVNDLALASITASLLRKKSARNIGINSVAS